MRLIHRQLKFFAPGVTASGRVLIPCANVILLVAFTSLLSCAPAACAQSIQAPEQCNYATDQDPRPATSNASAEAAAAANSYAAPEASAAEGLRLPELKSDGASAGQQNVECKPEDGKTAPSAAPKAATPAAAPAPPPPAPLAAYSNGMLTITAHGARFGDVLDAIKTSTGVAVQYPTALANDRVFDELGPAPMREVLAAFLEGSRFNYVIVGSSNPQIVKGLILTSRTGGSTAMATNRATPAGMKEADAYGGAPADTQQDEPQAQPIPVPAARVNPLPAAVGKSLQDEAAALQAANPQMTHGEILAEMQKRNDDRLDQEAAQSDAQQPPPQQ
jgi:hypothetical protein